MDRSLLDDILAPGGLTAVFQPIFEVSGPSRRLFGIEGLVRGPAGTNAESAEVLFEYVRRKREESLVDRACVRVLLEAARLLPASLSLSINVHAATLGRDPEFVVYLGDTARACSIDLSRLVLEIVEHTPCWEGKSFSDAIKCLRDVGAAVALDEVGMAQSNYKLILDCRPQYFKIDRYFVQGLHKDFYRAAVLESLAMLAQRFGGRVIAEGVETAADLEAVTSLGIDLIQGHLFCPALSAPRLANQAFMAHTDMAVAGEGPPIQGAG